MELLMGGDYKVQKVPTINYKKGPSIRYIGQNFADFDEFYVLKFFLNSENF